MIIPLRINNLYKRSKLITHEYGYEQSVQELYHNVPEKIIIGVSASITFNRIDQSIISGYETITYYLPFAENRIKLWSSIVTQIYEFS